MAAPGQARVQQDDHIHIAWREGTAHLAGAPTGDFGTAFPGADGAQGVFGRWRWDGEKLSAEVDRFGFFSLFYCETAEGIALSPNILRLIALGCDPAPDTRARAVFHRLGLYINNDTPFAAIKALGPGGRLTWAAGKLTVEETPLEITPQSLTRDAAVDGMVALFRQAMERALAAWDGEIVLPLSGGRDSRHILLELIHQGRRPERCITFHHCGNAPNREAQAARALCEATGTRHDMLGFHRPRLADSFRATVLTQLCADEHAQMMPLHDYFLDRQAAAFDGIAGDILTNPDNDADRYFHHAERGDYAAIARELTEGHGRVISRGQNGRGAGPIYSPEQDAEALDYLTETIAGFADAPDPYQVFWLLNRTRREINFVPTGILSAAPAVFCPYLDPDFVAFCVSLPYEITKDQQLHNDAIARAYPDFTHVPFEEGFTAAAPQRSGLGHKLRVTRDAGRIGRALVPGAGWRTARALLSRGKALNPGPHEMYALNAAFLDGLDAARALDLLGMAEALTADRPTRLVSDRWQPDAGEPG